MRNARRLARLRQELDRLVAARANAMTGDEVAIEDAMAEMARCYSGGAWSLPPRQTREQLDAKIAAMEVRITRLENR